MVAVGRRVACACQCLESGEGQLTSRPPGVGALQDPGARSRERGAPSLYPPSTSEIASSAAASASFSALPDLAGSLGLGVGDDVERIL
jgi:hypothetical protein